MSTDLQPAAPILFAVLDAWVQPWNPRTCDQRILTFDKHITDWLGENKQAFSPYQALRMLLCYSGSLQSGKPDKDKEHIADLLRSPNPTKFDITQYYKTSDVYALWAAGIFTFAKAHRIVGKWFIEQITNRNVRYSPAFDTFRSSIMGAGQQSEEDLRRKRPHTQEEYDTPVMRPSDPLLLEYTGEHTSSGIFVPDFMLGSPQFQITPSYEFGSPDPDEIDLGDEAVSTQTFDAPRLAYYDPYDDPNVMNIDTPSSIEPSTVSIDTPSIVYNPPSPKGKGRAPPNPFPQSASGGFATMNIRDMPHRSLELGGDRGQVPHLRPYNPMHSILSPDDVRHQLMATVPVYTDQYLELVHRNPTYYSRNIGNYILSSDGSPTLPTTPRNYDHEVMSTEATTRGDFKMPYLMV